MNNMENITNILEWYIEAGVDETIDTEAISFMEAKEVKISTNTTPKTIISSVETIKQSYNVSLKADTLDELKNIILNFEGCNLKQTAKNTVFGDGNPNADIMFIGEAPGADEDKIGLPFVGRSGQLLTKIITAAGFKRENCFISNILPWRPPGNRTPTATEVSTCLPFIKKQIELVSPKYIIFLGGSAANSILDNAEPISRLRGKWLEYKTSEQTISALATFHPAFLLRNPAQKAKIWADFVKLKKMFD